MSNIVLVDLDGTLADASARQHHLEKNPRDWDGYYAQVGNDIPHMEMIDMVNALSDHYLIVIITGRIEATREATEQWLESNNCTHHILIMRPDGDRTDDHIWKVNIGHLFGLDNIAFVIEDRNRIVEAWRKLNIRCLQTDVGDF